MAKSKGKKNSNWSHYVKEILLLFIGINLAIFFNNWNENRKLNSEIKQSLSKIESELNTNLTVLNENKEELEKFHGELKAYYAVNRKRTESEILTFNEEHKMIKVGANSGMTFNFDYPLLNLKRISWDILRGRDAFKKLNYECIYEIENCYQLIEKFQSEFDKSHNYLQEHEIKKFTSTLNYITQINPQLQSMTKELINILKTCH